MPRLKLYRVHHDGRCLVTLNGRVQTGATLGATHLVVATSKRHALTLAQLALGTTMVLHPDGKEWGHPIRLDAVRFVGYCDAEGKARPATQRRDGVPRPRR